MGEDLDQLGQGLAVERNALSYLVRGQGKTSRGKRTMQNLRRISRSAAGRVKESATSGLSKKGSEKKLGKGLSQECKDHFD